MRTLILGANQRFFTKVSDQDYEWLIQWRWQYKQSCRRWKSGVYAKRTTTVEGRKVTLLLSHVILIERLGQPRPGDDFDADHIDGDSLNNQRENLRWMHRKANRARAGAQAYDQYQEAA